MATVERRRYSSTPSRTSLIDIRRPSISDRYQLYGGGVSRYSSNSDSGPPSFSPTFRYQHQRSPSPSQQPTTYKYFGNLNYATSYAKNQGIGAYTKLLRYSFASGSNRDRSSDSATPAAPSFTSRSSYYEPGYTSRYRSNATATASSYSRPTSNTASSPLNRVSISRRTDSDDATDLYKTRFRPTGAMSKYWLQPRKLFTGREDD